METIDPATGRPLPTDAIQRVLFIHPSVNVYAPPPLTSLKGWVAAEWTKKPEYHIAMARVRVLETATPDSKQASGERISAAVVLEVPETGELFAAAPYRNAGVVEQCTDSSRFFAVRVEDPSGRKAMLGLGFFDRSEAFDFSVTLQELRKTLGLEPDSAPGKKPVKEKEVPKKDFSLKEGETITVNIGGIKPKGRRGVSSEDTKRSEESSSGFSLPPPPAGGGFLPPPPSAQEVKAQKRLSQTITTPQPGSIEDMGFDDGEFGEFQ